MSVDALHVTWKTSASSTHKVPVKLPEDNTTVLQSAVLYCLLPLTNFNITHSGMDATTVLANRDIEKKTAPGND